MEKTNNWGTVGVSTEKPNIARYYDYLLGGFHNFAVDRKMGDMVIQACPDIRLGALANRAFLRRAVKFLCQEGVEQFLDLGSGIPTSGNVHEVAQKINPEARVIYVDNDPVAVIHSQEILKDNPNASTFLEDILNIEKILEHPDFKGLIDLRKPVGVLLLSVLHLIPDDSKVRKVLRVLKNKLASGSYIVISHYSLEGAPAETVEQLSRLSTSDGSKSRTKIETVRLFNGFELVEPGVVRASLWRPESSEELLVEEPERALAYAGVGRKP